MSCWGNRQGLTEAEVTHAITAHSNIAGITRFLLTTEDRYTIITAVNTPPMGPPIGQKVRHTSAKPRFKPPKTKKRSAMQYQQLRAGTTKGELHPDDPGK